MEVNLKLDRAIVPDESLKYRNFIGELLYISCGTRPNIAFRVNYLSLLQSCYDKTHYNYAMRVLKYLIRTKDVKIVFKKNVNCDELDCMIDSDYAGDTNDRKSTSGYVVRMNGNLIYWKSRKQSSVLKCSTFAEYIAMSEAVTEF